MNLPFLPSTARTSSNFWGKSDHIPNGRSMIRIFELEKSKGNVNAKVWEWKIQSVKLSTESIFFFKHCHVEEANWKAVAATALG